MRGITLAIAGLTACLSAPAAAAIEGTYVANLPETASALRLLPGGRFEWFFSQGALDLQGSGRWSRRDDRTLLLTSDPPVVPPRFTLLERRRDGEPGLLVKVVDASGAPANFLDVRAEYSDGSGADGFIQEGGEYRFAAEAGRSIVALFLGSAVFDFVSERYPVAADEANVISFRFEANDVGKHDFQAHPVTLEPRALEMSWKGLELRYALTDQPEE